MVWIELGTTFDRDLGTVKVGRSSHAAADRKECARQRWGLPSKCGWSGPFTNNSDKVLIIDTDYLLLRQAEPVLRCNRAENWPSG